MALNKHDETFKTFYKEIFDKGRIKKDRTGVGTKSIFGTRMQFYMEDGFPLLTLRKIHLKSLVHELLWFLTSYDAKYKKFGNTNLRYLLDMGVTFWTEWCYDDYKKEYTDKFLETTDRKKFKLLSIKEFEDRIKEDDEFALKYGDLGPVYGKQWMDWGGYKEKTEVTKEYQQTKSDTKLVSHIDWIDVKYKGINQIDNIIETLQTSLDNRRMLVSAWNVSDIDDCKLPPCHILYQFYTDEMTFEERNEYAGEYKVLDIENKKFTEQQIERFHILWNEKGIPKRKLSIQMYQRSCDSYLGVPFNVASYSLLLHMVAHVVNMIPSKFVWLGGDTHLYLNSLDATKEIIQRESFEVPQLKIKRKVESIYDFRYEDFEFTYQAHANIHVDVAV
jgi:thymidylate synthase